MSRSLRVLALVGLLCSTEARGADGIAELSSGDAETVARALEALRTQRRENIKQISDLLARSYAKGDTITAVNCIRVLGDLRASETAAQLVEYATLTVHETTKEGYIRPGKLRGALKMWPALGALSKMGLDGVRAIHKALLDPARNPKKLLRPSAIVTRHVLGDFAVEYVTRMLRDAKGDEERRRLEALREWLKKAQ
jgi:hypothetical protein